MANVLQDRRRRRRRRARRALVTGLVAVVGLLATAVPAGADSVGGGGTPVSSDPDQATCGVVYPHDAAHYDATVRNRADSWLGADATGQVDLGDGRLLWLMGDTDWGRRRADGSYAPGWTTTTNSMFVQVGSCLDSVREGRNVVPLPPDADLHWPLDGWVHGDDVFLVVAKIRLTGNLFGFRSNGHDLVRLDADTLRFEARWPVPDRSKNWGSSVERVGDTVYWFGRPPVGAAGNPGHMHLARTPVDRPLELEYRTATGWSRNPALAVPVHRRGTPSNASFTRLPDGRWAATFKDHEFLGRHIEAHVAPNPWGPWAHMGRIADTRPGAGEITYGGYLAHEVGWFGSGTALLKWSHNALTPGEVAAGRIRYRPAFTTVSTSVFARPEGLLALQAQRNYVERVYGQFLGRAPSAAWGDYWANDLNFGVPRGRLTAAVARSDEWLARQIDAIYLAALGRRADASGLANWTAYVRAGGRLTDVGVKVFASREFFLRSGATHSGFVRALYQKILGRSPDPGGLASWVRALREGRSRTWVARGFYGSYESRADRVTSLYRQLLDRDPDATGMRTWTRVLVHSDDVRLAETLARSHEFFQKAQSPLP